MIDTVGPPHFGITITPGGVADADILHRLMLEAFDEFRGTLAPPSSALSETVDDMARALANGGAVIAWDQAQAVGFARFRVVGAKLEAWRVSVMPSHRRRGIAGRLMAAVSDIAQELGCNEVQVEVRCSLPTNVALYQSLGFGVERRVEHPRDSTASFFVMTLKLDRNAPTSADPPS